jgi:hypothetical protein
MYRQAEEMSRDDEARGASMAATPVGFCCAAERYDDLPGVEARVRATFAAMGHDLGSCIGEMLVAQLYGRAGDRRRAEEQLRTVPPTRRFRASKRPCGSRC